MASDVMGSECRPNVQSDDKSQAEDALAAAIQALSLDPQSIRTLVGLADAMLENNLYLDAEKLYRVAKALDPQIVGVTCNLRRIDELKRNRT
jgi:cytochrome c-type biogenesis protein CcmH/NrfG